MEPFANKLDENNRYEDIAEKYNCLSCNNQNNLPPGKVADPVEKLLVLSEVINKGDKRKDKESYLKPLVIF